MKWTSRALITKQFMLTKSFELDFFDVVLSQRIFYKFAISPSFVSLKSFEYKHWILEHKHRHKTVFSVDLVCKEELNLSVYFIVILLALVRPILLHRTHNNETQYLQKDNRQYHKFLLKSILFVHFEHLKLCKKLKNCYVNMDPGLICKF